MNNITCPVCGMTSYHPRDIDQGYCGNCHDWTSDPNERTDRNVPPLRARGDRDARRPRISP